MESGKSRNPAGILRDLGVRDPPDGCGPPGGHDCTVTNPDAHMLDSLALERLIAERVLATGTVKSVERGHGGTISPDEGDDDLAFRSTVPLSVGVRVAFEVDVGHDGLRAFNVTKLPPR